MKKALFTAALLCMISVFAQAQYHSLIINNNNDCDVYVKIYGTNSATCATDYSTPGYIAVPAGGFLNLTDPSVVTPKLQKGGATLGSSDYFTMIEVASQDPNGSCGAPTTVLISDCATGATSHATGFSFYNTSCAPCTSNGDIDWQPGGSAANIFIQ